MHQVLMLEELVDEDGEPFGYFALEAVDDDDLEWPWLHGERFDGVPSRPIRLKVDADDEGAGAFADYVAGPIPLVTAGLRAVWQSCGVSNVDYYPVEVDGAEQFDDFPVYFAINVIGVVSAAGPGTVSSQTFGRPGADLIEQFVVDPKLPPDLPLFRLAEHLSTLVVSDRVARACESAGIDTVRTMPLDQWST
jgi:hypothetical protein